MEEDKFNENIKDIKTLMKNLNSDIKIRLNNKEDILLESKIRGLISKGEGIINACVIDLKKMKENPTKYNLDLQEFNRRMKLFQDVKNSFVLTKKEFEQFQIKQANINKNNDETSSEIDSKISFLNNLNQKELQEQYKEDLNKNDEFLDECYNLLKQNRKTGFKMADELVVQNKHLDEFDASLDNVDSKVKRTNKKMEQYSNSSNNYYLVMIITIQLLILFIILFMF